MRHSNVRYTGNDADFMRSVYDLESRCDKYVHDVMIKYSILMTIFSVVIIIVLDLYKNTLTFGISAVTVFVVSLLGYFFIASKTERHYIHNRLGTEDEKYAVFLNLQYLSENDQNLEISIEDNRFVAKSKKIGNWYFKEFTVKDTKEHIGYYEIDWNKMECSS